MPETYFTLRWPNGHEERCYSPSSVVAEYFAEGQTYAMPEFLDRARAALGTASQRVEQKFGYFCTSAMSQLEMIEARAAAFKGAGQVEIARVEITGQRKAPR